MLIYEFYRGSGLPASSSCDTVEQGYVCSPSISRFWGQYSPYYSVPSDISTSLPDREACQINFVQILSRHGARDPTASKTAKYSALVDHIHNSTTSYSSEFAFIEDYEYSLGTDDLSFFGQQQMVYSGMKFYDRYKPLTRDITPFVRSSGSDRVVESAQNWTQGFHAARHKDTKQDDVYPYPIVVISEDAGANNSLNHGLCTSFETGNDSTISDTAQSTWASIFTLPIIARLNEKLPGVNFTAIDTVYFMDLCPFNTVGNDLGTISPFCALFTEAEWKDYDYYNSLGKYYGYGWGNPLGATQGVGFTNELIARLTNTPVHDHTSTNTTLDSSQATFPLSSKPALYADFSHDSDMMSIFSALGLYNETLPLPVTSRKTNKQTKGYSAAWTTSFASRAYVEKMTCKGQEEELVRVVVNDRVLPLETCGGDHYGRCRLDTFVDSLSWAQAGGDWAQCFL